MDKEELNNLSNRIIGIAIDIHKYLGPGFVEKIYEKALAYELQNEKIKFVEQEEMKVGYKSIELGYQRIDFLIDNEMIVELKFVSEINEIHEAQLLSYLKVTNKKLGLILNFAKKRLEIKRLVNKL